MDDEIITQNSEKNEFDENDNSEKNENNEEQTSENKDQEDGSTSDKKESKDKQEKKDEIKDDKIPDYRPKPDKDKPELTSAEKKIAHMNKEMKKMKAELEEYKKGNLKNNNEPDLQEIADELGVDVKTVKKMKSVLGASDNSELRDEIKELKSGQSKAENEKNFSADFDRWAKDNPQRQGLKEFYKKISFDPDHINLKNFDEMEKHFFPKAPKTKKTEAGTAGVKNNGEKVDFNKMTEEQHKEVMKNPKLKKEYMQHLLSQGDSVSWED